MTRVRFMKWLNDQVTSGGRSGAGAPAPTTPAPAAAAATPTPAPWAAETVVSRALATELIEHQFPALTPAGVELFGKGWDNTAYLVNGSHVFRFPRRQVAVQLLQAEAELLPALAPRLPQSIPVPLLRGRPSSRYGWPFLGYALVPGRTACGARLDDEQRRGIAEPLGRFLGDLHRFPVTEADRLGAPGDSIGRLDLPSRLPRCRVMMDALAPSLDPGVVARLMAIIDSSIDIQAPNQTVLCHGDLYARHLLLDDQARLCGVIDWGDIHLGQPAVDLSVAHAFLPPSPGPRSCGRTGGRSTRKRGAWPAGGRCGARCVS